MRIVASSIGKRYNREWIFRDLSQTFESGKTYALIGPNGSGKSTLSQVLWGQMPVSKGTIQYFDGEREIEAADIFKFVSVAAPYMDLIDELTLAESVDFHFRFKKMIPGIDNGNILKAMDLEHARDKKIGAFSSGMKQRTKLALAFYSDTPLLFLDEPTSNLDATGVAWYHEQKKLCASRLVLIASNQPSEYPADAVKIELAAYKPRLQKATASH